MDIGEILTIILNVIMIITFRINRTEKGITIQFGLLKLIKDHINKK